MAGLENTLSPSLDTGSEGLETWPQEYSPYKPSCTTPPPATCSSTLDTGVSLLVIKKQLPGILREGLRGRHRAEQSRRGRGAESRAAGSTTSMTRTPTDRAEAQLGRDKEIPGNERRRSFCDRNESCDGFTGRPGQEKASD